MAKKITVSSDTGTVDVELPVDRANKLREVLETAQAEGSTILNIYVVDPPQVTGWFPGDIVSTLPVDLPLPPPGEIWRRIDPRVPGNDKFNWLIITDKDPSSPATAPQLPDLTVISELTQLWTYLLTVDLLNNPTRTRAQYTTSNDTVSQTGRYNFTPEFLDAACDVFTQTFGPEFTCSRLTNSTTNVIYNFFFNGEKVTPEETEADVIDWMLLYLGGTILESRRYSLTPAGLDALANSPTPGVIEGLWDDVNQYIEDGYGT